MNISVDGKQLIAFLLAMTRVAGFMVVAPPFSTRGVIPYPAKAAIAAGLGLIGVPILAKSALPETMGLFLGSLVIQAFTGAALGFIVLLLISAAMTAGSLGDLLGGIVLPPSLDPLSEDQVPLMGQLYEQVALVLLFVTNGELILVEGLFVSFKAQGFQSLASAAPVADILTKGLETMFVASLEIAAPLLIVLFAAQIVLGLLAKVAPQMNVFFIGFPFQVLVTIIMVALAIRVMPASVGHLVERMMHDMAEFIHVGA
jgi:flagellar biosynthetic protein FliR